MHSSAAILASCPALALRRRRRRVLLLLALNRRDRHARPGRRLRVFQALHLFVWPTASPFAIAGYSSGDARRTSTERSGPNDPGSRRGDHHPPWPPVVFVVSAPLLLRSTPPLPGRLVAHLAGVMLNR